MRTIAHRHRYSSLWRTRSQLPRSPFGDVDWAHPLARGLVGVWVFGHANMGPGARNLVTGAGPNSITGSPPHVLGPEGPCIRTNSASDFLAQNSVDTYGASGLIPFTLAARFVPATGAAAIQNCAIRTGTTVRNALRTNATNNPSYQVAYGGTTRTISGTSVIDGTRAHTVMGTTRAELDHQLFVNGVGEASSAASPGTAPGQRDSLQVGTSRDGVLWYAVWAWARGFTAEEARHFAADPYGMLIPAG